MATIYVKRQGSILLPISASDDVEMLRLPERRIITIEADARAPLKMKRWFHAMVQLLCEATGRWPTPAEAKKEILIRTGFFESFVIDADGSTRYSAQSTADWQYLEWRAFLDKAVPFVVENYVGETRAQFRNRVDAFLGVKLKEAWEHE